MFIGLVKKKKGKKEGKGCCGVPFPFFLLFFLFFYLFCIEFFFFAC